MASEYNRNETTSVRLFLIGEVFLWREEERGGGETCDSGYICPKHDYRRGSNSIHRTLVATKIAQLNLEKHMRMQELHVYFNR